MVTSATAVALAEPITIQAAVVRQQSVPAATYASTHTAATFVSPKAMPHASLLPLRLYASTLASPPQQLGPASSTQTTHYMQSHSASAPSLPALLLSANHQAASILSPSISTILHPTPLSLSFTASANGAVSCMPLQSAFDLSSSMCRSKQRLARKAELARQSRKRKKSAIAQMADTIRQLADDNMQLRQRLSYFTGVPTDSRSSTTRGQRKASYKSDSAHTDDEHRVKQDEEAEASEQEEGDDECPSELTNSSEDEEGEEIQSGAAELAALSPSSTPSSVASSLLSAASSIDMPFTALMGKRGRT